MGAQFPPATDQWILDDGEMADIVVSSRARLARNLPHAPFAPRANKEQLGEVVARVRTAFEESGLADRFRRFALAELSENDRRFLRESHLISAEMEKRREHREVWLDDDARTSVMINEEDHLRFQTLVAGFDLDGVLREVEELVTTLERKIDFAYDREFGYLTACPTNTGTGLRVSVMLHLVALVLTNQIDEALAPLGNFGLVVRGGYGEHSGHQGELYQISNEVTLGKTEEELARSLEQVVRQIIERERQARAFLIKHARAKYEDAILRAMGVLRCARCMDSGEALSLLSRVRLGVGGDFGLKLTHGELNRLMIDVQPAHLARRIEQLHTSDERDVARAGYLRERFQAAEPESRN